MFCKEELPQNTLPAMSLILPQWQTPSDHSLPTGFRPDQTLGDLGDPQQIWKGRPLHACCFHNSQGALFFLTSSSLVLLLLIFLSGSLLYYSPTIWDGDDIKRRWLAGLDQDSTCFVMLLQNATPSPSLLKIQGYNTKSHTGGTEQSTQKQYSWLLGKITFV